MRALVQTVSRASVTVDGTVVGAIGDGLLILVGVTHSDTAATARQLARKAYELRILDDERAAAAPAEVAEPLVDAFAEALRERGATVATGQFRARMLVESINVGPRTVLL